MRKFSNLLFSSICALSLLASCAGKDGDPGPAGAAGATGPTGPSGQNLTGNLFGFVNPLDENGQSLAKNGVVVTLEGVTPAATATTDANGRYEFANLRNGTYNLTYTRGGLGTLRRLGVGHIGGDQATFLGTNTLVQPSTNAVSNFSFGPPSGTSVPFVMTITNINPSVSLRATIFVGTSSSVNSNTGTALGTYIASANGTVNTSFSKATLNSAGLVSGTTGYAIAYGSPTTTTIYTDPTTGRSVYTSLSTTPSSVVSFIVP
ncbi:Carboxypeptidase regulatory-like domain-containing protein [Hymenobacter daecheongensis DSM 21074]|uniref:Carboxypeptidase regulatory-like domain-containing protein n=1 Tax=Hymenobacter daecheongensis DSM 21074 TaxID=1121955 RepID=A0A1M6A216_9BACT|nr:carboxypeptidase regulatory-like domain-containing protein [Hymenobacter daecheongensis]SHI30544.1 Carboxypeptidase regulatory-like domain-containing protein [Hymenobacter daecheongensis DSM 21074]